MTTITANACSRAGPGSVRAVLFDPRAHEPLRDAAWSPAAAEAAIRAIARDADEALRDGEWWPLHPLDDDGETPDALHGIYLGAAGVLWALDHLARAGLHEPGHDYARLAADALESYRRRPEFGGPRAEPVARRGRDRARRLAARARRRRSRTASPSWPSPRRRTTRSSCCGAARACWLIADAMLERTGEAALGGGLERDRRGPAGPLGRARAALLDPAALRRRARSSSAPAHGLAGRRRRRSRAGRSCCRTTGCSPARCAALAVDRGPRRTGWPTGRPRSARALVHRTGTIRTQWCHGAPGRRHLARRAAPRRELDALLLEGGELTWAAGPLRKGAGLCHGTAGNGFALLKLFARTGDERLARARAALRDARGAQVEADRRAPRARPAHALDRRPRHRDLPARSASPAAPSCRLSSCGDGRVARQPRPQLACRRAAPA